MLGAGGRLTPRRIEFRVAVLRQGRKMYDVAADLGVSYNHLILVLDGNRTGSARLEVGIRKVLEQWNLSCAADERVRQHS